jgi:hypothetical protein
MGNRREKIKQRKTKTGNNRKWRGEKRGKERNMGKQGKVVGANKKAKNCATWQRE